MSDQAVFERLFDMNAERAFLGAVLIDPNIMRKALLQPQDFYKVENQTLWTSFLETHNQGKIIDAITIAATLGQRLLDVGGSAYITGLMTACLSSMNWEDYQSIIMDKAARRQALRIVNDLTVGIFSDEPLQEKISQATSKLVMTLRNTGGAVPIGSYVSGAYDEILAASKKPRDIYGISTGLSDWDRITAGNQRGETCLLAGEPGIGKSILKTQLCVGMSHEAPGVMYELEMSGRATVRRQLSEMSGVSTRLMRSGKLQESDWPGITEAVEELSMKPIYMSDNSQMTTADIRADLSRLVETSGVQWFAVDYMDLLGDRWGKNEIERMAFVSKQLHGIAKDMNLFGLIITPLTKASIKGNSSDLGDIAGSKGIIYDADQAVIMHKDKENENMVDLIWTKNREGEKSFMRLVRRKGLPAFGQEERANAQRPGVR